MATRRPRSDKDVTPTLFHLMGVQGTSSGEHHTKPIVSDSSAGADLFMSQRLWRALFQTNAVRCWIQLWPSGVRIIIEAEQTARVNIVTGVGETKADALRLTEKYFDHHQANRVFELAWTHRQVALRQLNITEVDAQLYVTMSNSILYANPLRRASRSIMVKNRRGQSGLWGYGISGDLPIVLLRIGSSEKTDLVRQLVQAHGYWRMLGLPTELVIWNDDNSGYRQLLHDQIMQLVTAGSQTNQIARPGGIFVIRSDQMSEEDRWLLQTVARAIITDGGGTLADQVERRARRQNQVAAFVATEMPTSQTGIRPAPRFHNLTFL